MLAFSSNAFKKNSLDQAIDSIASIGYRAVELMADLHHAHPLSFDSTRRAETKKRLNDLGLVVSNVNAFTHFVDGDTYNPTWIDDDASRVSLRIEHTRRSIEMAAEFGCATISIQPGGPLIGRKISRDEAENRFADSLSKCLETARAHKVIIGIEPEPGLLIESADEYLVFKHRFFRSEPIVKMNCDIGHLFCVGDDPAEIIRTLPEQIAHVHLEDIGANRVHQHLTPGHGVIKFDEVFDALDSIGYTGWTTVELYPYVLDATGVAREAFEKLNGLNDK